MPSNIGASLTSKQAKKLVSQLFQISNKIRAGRPISSAPRLLKKLLTPKTWSETFWGGAFKVFGALGVIELARGIISAGAGASVVLVAHIWPELATRGVTLVADKITDLSPMATTLAGVTVGQIFGDANIAEEIDQINGLEPAWEHNRAMGNLFTRILPATFRLEEAAEDFKTRTNREGSKNNLSRYFGTNLNFQLRSLTISTVASMFGWTTLHHLEGLHQSVNWAFGFGWMSWSVLSAVMDVTITKGLKEHYNAQIKPNDLTLAQALRAYCEGKFHDPDFSQLLDNEGIRPDVREIMIEQHRHKLSLSQIVDCQVQGRITLQKYQEWMAEQAVRPDARDFMELLGEATLSKEQLTQLFQKGKIDRAFLVQHYRYKSFGQDRAEMAADLIVRQRSEELEDKLTVQLGKLYRDCVITEVELRQWLYSQSYTAAEADLFIKLELATRQQRSFLTTHDLFKSVELGLTDLESALTHLTCRGFTPEDALNEAIVRLGARLPQCDTTALSGPLLIALLQALVSKWGFSGILLNPFLLQYIACLGQGGPSVAPTATLSCAPADDLGPGWLRLTWATTDAEEVSINHGIGPVPANGTIDEKVSTSRGYLLTAKNQIGHTTAFTWVQIDHDPPAGGA